MASKKPTATTTLRSADLRFLREGAWIMFSNKKPNPNDWWKTEKLPHLAIFNDAAEFLKSKGFRPYVDHKFQGTYKSLADNYRWAVRNRLRVEMRIFPAGFEIQFYQNVNHENPYGGKYDFNKYEKMPPSMKRNFNRIAQQLIDRLVKTFGLTYYDQSTLTIPRMTAEQQIIKRFNETSFDRTDIKKLKEIPKYMSDYDRNHNSKSGAGEQIQCGELRRYKDMNGKMRRGKAYHNINNMWWMVRSKYEYNNVASFDIFEKVKA